MSKTQAVATAQERGVQPTLVEQVLEVASASNKEPRLHDLLHEGIRAVVGLLQDVEPRTPYSPEELRRRVDLLAMARADLVRSIAVAAYYVGHEAGTYGPDRGDRRAVYGAQRHGADAAAAIAVLEISMTVDKQGRRWFAWRETVGGWFLGVGATTSPPDRWSYLAEVAPKTFPSASAGWAKGPFPERTAED